MYETDFWILWIFTKSDVDRPEAYPTKVRLMVEMSTFLCVEILMDLAQPIEKTGWYETLAHLRRANIIFTLFYLSLLRFYFCSF
jgi:hypothetical protein